MGRRRGRNEVIKDDSEEKDRATKQQGLAVDEMEGVESLEGSDGGSSAKRSLVGNVGDMSHDADIIAIFGKTCKNWQQAGRLS